MESPRDRSVFDRMGSRYILSKVTYRFFSLAPLQLNSWRKARFDRHIQWKRCSSSFLLFYQTSFFVKINRLKIFNDICRLYCSFVHILKLSRRWQSKQTVACRGEFFSSCSIDDLCHAFLESIEEWCWYWESNDRRRCRRVWKPSAYFYYIP